jgi:hypothetical protein
MDKIINLSEKNVDKEILSETVKILEESKEYMKENTINLSKHSEDKENTDKNKLTDLDNNLSDNKIDTVIKPTTDGNNVYVSICSCSLYIGCCTM